MTISKDDLLKRREELASDYEKAVAEIEKGESQIKGMKNNLMLWQAHFNKLKCL